MLNNLYWYNTEQEFQKVIYIDDLNWSPSELIIISYAKYKAYWPSLCSSSEHFLAFWTWKRSITECDPPGKCPDCTVEWAELVLLMGTNCCTWIPT